MAKGDISPNASRNLSNYGLGMGSDYLGQKIGGPSGRIAGELINQIGGRYIPGIAGPIGVKGAVSSTASKALGGGGGLANMANLGNLGGIGLGIGANLIGEGHGKTTGAMRGAGTGMQIGSMIMPGIGTGIGAGIGALAGAIKGHQNATVKDREKFASQAGFGNLGQMYEHLNSIGRNDLAERGLNVIGKTDHTDNAKWMGEVQAALGGGAGPQDTAEQGNWWPATGDNMAKGDMGGIGGGMRAAGGAIPGANRLAGGMQAASGTMGGGNAFGGAVRNAAGYGNQPPQSMAGGMAGNNDFMQQLMAKRQMAQQQGQGQQQSFMGLQNPIMSAQQAAMGAMQQPNANNQAVPQMAAASSMAPSQPQELLQGLLAKMQMPQMNQGAMGAGAMMGGNEIPSAPNLTGMMQPQVEQQRAQYEQAAPAQAAAGPSPEARRSLFRFGRGA